MHPDRPPFSQWMLATRPESAVSWFIEHDACWPDKWDKPPTAQLTRIEHHLVHTHGIDIANERDRPFYREFRDAWEDWKKLKLREFIKMAQTFRQWIEQFEDEGDSRRGFYARHWRAITPGRISSAQGVEAGLARHRTGLVEAGAEDPSHDAHQALKSVQLAMEIHPEMVKAYDERPDRPRPKDKGGATVTALPGGYVPAAGQPAPPEASFYPAQQPFWHNPSGEVLMGTISAPPEVVLTAPAPVQEEHQGTRYELFGEPADAKPAGNPPGFNGGYWFERFNRLEAKLDRIEKILSDLARNGIVTELAQVAQDITDLRANAFAQAFPIDWERLYAMADFQAADQP